MTADESHKSHNDAIEKEAPPGKSKPPHDDQNNVYSFSYFFFRFSISNRNKRPKFQKKNHLNTKNCKNY